MVKVKFLQDFRGKLTREAFFLLGEVVEFDAAIAQALVNEKRAEFVEVETVEPEPVNSEEKPRRKKRINNGLL